MIGTPKVERKGPYAMSSVVSAVWPGLFYAGIVSLGGAALSDFLGKALGSAIERALATETSTPPSEHKEWWRLIAWLMV